MHLVEWNHAESEGEGPLGGAVCAAGEKKGTVRKKRRGVRRTLYPGYLLSAREGVVEARDVGHDGLFIRTGSAHNVCEGGGGVGWGGGWSSLNRLMQTRGSNNDINQIFSLCCRSSAFCCNFSFRLDVWQIKTGTKTTFLPPHQLTFCVQHLGDVQVLLGHVEGRVQVGHRVVLTKEDATNSS